MTGFLKKLAFLSAFFSKTFALWVILFAVLAFYFPQYFLGIKGYISLLLGVVMFGMGLTLSVNDFSEVFKRTVQVLIGILGQFVLMPLIAFTLVLAFNLPSDIAAGVMLVGCCPGGTSSNVMSYLGKGDVPLSVTITACTTVLAPVVTPALFYLFASQWLEVDPIGMFISIVQIVILPIVGGVIINALFRTTINKVVIALPLVSVFAIIAIVAAVVAVSAEKIATTGILIFVVVALHNCIGYALGFVLAKVCGFKLKQKKTLAIEIGMQNSGLAATLGMSLAAKAAVNPVVAVPGAIFSVWHNISGPIIATIFANLKDQNERE